MGVIQRDEMSQVTDKPTETPDEDRASIKSNEKTPTRLRSFRESIRRVAEKSPLSSGGKRSKVTAKADAESGSQPPPSPSEYRQGRQEITQRQEGSHVRMGGST